jgi:hypothetical protein
MALNYVDYDNLINGDEYVAIARENQQMVQGAYVVRVINKPNAEYIILEIISVYGPRVPGLEYIATIPRTLTVRADAFEFFKPKLGAGKSKIYEICGGTKGAKVHPVPEMFTPNQLSKEYLKVNEQLKKTPDDKGLRAYLRQILKRMTDELEAKFGYKP